MVMIYLNYTLVVNHSCLTIWSCFTLVLGQPIECVVESTNEVAHTVTLRAQRKSVVEAVTRGSKLTFNALAPGMLVNAIVDTVSMVSILRASLLPFRGFVRSNHVFLYCFTTYISRRISS